DYVLFSLKIVDELTKKQLEKCTYTLQDELNEETVTAMEENGTRIFKLIPNRKYTLTIGHPIYKQYVRPIWTTNPKEREIKLTAELGRRVKNFVHATIVNDDNDQPESQTNVFLINLDSLRSDSLKRFFDKSEFDFEVDNSTRYVLVSQKGNRIAVEEIKPTKNKKASSMVYTPLRLKKFYPFEIKGIVKDKETKSLLPGYLVTIRDMKLGDSYQIMTDDKGEFSFTGYTYTKYELAVENAENRTAFKDIDYIKAHGQIFELILK
ncbi:MAG: carboxypeptidase-like regulatory domain-containing protein, partial [Cytophagales bacterium]|nr:carboxypeptidase-like regulatory domain-containing protein [Cytophagales bacterium]